MNNKAQALIFASFVISMLIIFLALSVNSVEILRIKEDEELKIAMIYYLYSQSLAYGTQMAIEKYANNMIYNASKTIEAASFAEGNATEYLRKTHSKIKSLSKMKLDELDNINISIESTALRGKGSSFNIKVYNNVSTFMIIYTIIKESKIVSINESIQPYYKVIIEYNVSIFLKDTFTINSSEIKINIRSNTGEINFIATVNNNEIVLVFDISYKDKVVILLEDERGIVSWLLA